MSQNVFIGVDIGGSHYGVGILLEKNSKELVDAIEKNLDDTAPPESIIKDIYETINLITVSSDYNILAIGIGCPGHSKNGILHAASNLPTFVNVPIANILSDMLNGVTVILINDANSALAAEVWGSDLYHTYNNIAMITVGTGVGFALILDKKIHEGSNGLIEGGHMIIYPHDYISNLNIDDLNCSCGQLGCVEVFSSAKSATAIYNKLNNNEVTKVNGTKEIFDRALEGDSLANKVIDKAALGLAIMSINICRVVDPDIIIFGGGMIKAGESFIELIRKHINRLTWKILETNVKLVIARSISHAGILGAAYAAQNAYNRK